MYRPPILAGAADVVFAGAGSVVGLACTSRSSLSASSDSEPDGEVGVRDRRLRLDDFSSSGESDGERWREEVDGPDTRVTCDFNIVNDECRLECFFPSMDVRNFTFSVFDIQVTNQKSMRSSTSLVVGSCRSHNIRMRGARSIVSMFIGKRFQSDDYLIIVVSHRNFK